MMKKDRIAHVKEHFNSEADIFDERVVRIVPYYKDMLEALVAAVPFSPGRPVRVADLGCGTGTISYLIKKRFPKARITCVDLSQNMLDIAAKKLKGSKGTEFVLADLTKYGFDGKYDAIVSSLALHHISPGRDKYKIYEKICSALKKGGVFINADIIVSEDSVFQQIYLQKWAEFILRSYSKEQVRQNYQRYKREDRPAALLSELDMMKKAGFRHAEIFWKYYNFAVYGGVK